MGIYYAEQNKHVGKRVIRSRCAFKALKSKIRMFIYYAD